MILGRFSPRGVLITCAAILVSTVTGGGLALATAEDTSVRNGIWLSFNVVTTTGFGAGPGTAIGQLLSFVFFAISATCWFGVLATAMEIANLRTNQRVRRGDDSDGDERRRYRLSSVN